MGLLACSGDRLRRFTPACFSTTTSRLLLDRLSAGLASALLLGLPASLLGPALSLSLAAALPLSLASALPLSLSPDLLLSPAIALPLSLTEALSFEGCSRLLLGCCLPPLSCLSAATLWRAPASEDLLAADSLGADALSLILLGLSEASLLLSFLPLSALWGSWVVAAGC